jgi:5-methyltetrahydropteroyltriglutamate--homocysteine methyltransferase
MVIAANLGFPRIGAKRELKKAVEGYWKGAMSMDQLMQVAADLKKEHWTLQHRQGIDHIPSNDFSFYDQVLDLICTTGAIPERYGFTGEEVDLDTYFAMARGAQRDGLDVQAMEMTKWFDTNYHYIVPEFSAETEFAYRSRKAVEEFKEAKAQGIHTRPVIIGPVTFLLLGKMKDAENALSLLPKLLPVYEELLTDLAQAGADWVQIDEPMLVTDLPAGAQEAYSQAYKTLSNVSGKLHLMLATYFEALGDNLDLALNLPTAGLHVDLIRAPQQLDDVLAKWPGKKALSLGLFDGRNIWRGDLTHAVKTLEKTGEAIGNEWIQVAPSCSLLHTPVDLEQEEKLDSEIKTWLSFAKQKLAEVAIASTGIRKGRSAIRSELETNEAVLNSREASPLTNDAAVDARMQEITPEFASRKSPFGKRITLQSESLDLPLLPSTTIGSFPQTQEVRKARASFKKGNIDAQAYESFIKQETEKCIRQQEEVGLDMLVHGEFERNDMVEYFGEQLKGFTFTQFGWVQSYGSRCVKPPIIYGDVSRPNPMTVYWSEFAQSLTSKIMKGMLTGPVTILQWSFVRDDQPRSETCRQIALAIRDEVQDLEKAGIKAIQIDEAAFREGLPIRRADWKAYLDWAGESFRIATCGVEDETQIHTHMCYSEFNDIIEAIAEMDADVISIETSRSQMELLDAFVDYNYPNQIGPGVYDIHSPRVPNVEEMKELLTKALKVLAPQQLWVNPDCGLKTRGWAEVKPALQNMVIATDELRDEITGQKLAS